MAVMFELIAWLKIPVKHEMVVSRYDFTVMGIGGMVASLIIMGTIIIRSEQNGQGKKRPISLRTYPKIKKSLFYIQKPQVFEYKKVKFPNFGINTKGLRVVN
jgi:hypothetical protein